MSTPAFPRFDSSSLAPARRAPARQASAHRAAAGYALLVVLLFVGLIGMLSATYLRHVMLDSRNSSVAPSSVDAAGAVDSGLTWAQQAVLVSEPVTETTVENGTSSATVALEDLGGDHSRLLATAVDSDGVGATVLAEGARIRVASTGSSDELPWLSDDLLTALQAEPPGSSGSGHGCGSGGSHSSGGGNGHGNAGHGHGGSGGCNNGNSGGGNSGGGCNEGGSGGGNSGGGCNEGGSGGSHSGGGNSGGGGCNEGGSGSGGSGGGSSSGTYVTKLEYSGTQTVSNTDLNGLVVIHNGARITFDNVTINGALISENCIDGAAYGTFSANSAPTVIVGGGLRITPASFLPGVAVLMPDGVFESSTSSANSVQIGGDVVAHTVTLSGFGSISGNVASVVTPSLAATIERPGAGRAPVDWSPSLDVGDGGAFAFLAFLPRSSSVHDLSAITGFEFP